MTQQWELNWVRLPGCLGHVLRLSRAVAALLCGSVMYSSIQFCILRVQYNLEYSKVPVSWVTGHCPRPREYWRRTEYPGNTRKTWYSQVNWSFIFIYCSCPSWCWPKRTWSARQEMHKVSKWPKMSLTSQIVRFSNQNIHLWLILWGPPRITHPAIHANGYKTFFAGLGLLISLFGCQSANLVL